MASPSQPLLGEAFRAAPALLDEQCRVDEEVGTVEGDIRRLIGRKCALLLKRNSMAPINRIPDECLSIVFLWAQQAELDDALADNASRNTVLATPGCHDMYEGKAILALTQVCSRWRTISFGTTRLWAKLSVVIGKHTRSREKQAFHLDMLSQRLARSVAVPRLDLDVSFCARGPARTDYLTYMDDDRVGSAMKKDMDVLSPYFANCRRLCIHLPYWEAEHKLICDRLLVRMPRLECLLLSNPNNGLRKSVSIPFVGPCLDSLTLNRVDALNIRSDTLNGLSTLRIINSAVTTSPANTDLSDEEIELIRDSWRVTQHLRLLDSATSFDTLKSCTRLRSLELRDVALERPENPPTLTFSKLLYLNVSIIPASPEDADQPWTLITLIEQMTMPALQTLIIDASMAEGEDCETLLNCLADAHPPLTDLTLKSFTAQSATAYGALLMALPHLEDFRVSRGCFPSGVFARLVANSERTVLPKLKSLHLEDACANGWVTGIGMSRTSFEFTDLLQLVKSRFESSEVPALEELKLISTTGVFMRDWEMQLEPWVENLIVRSTPNRGFRPWSPTGDSDDDVWEFHEQHGSHIHHLQDFMVHHSSFLGPPPPHAPHSHAGPFSDVWGEIDDDDFDPYEQPYQYQSTTSATAAGPSHAPWFSDVFPASPQHAGPSNSAPLNLQSLPPLSLLLNTMQAGAAAAQDEADEEEAEAMLLDDSDGEEVDEEYEMPYGEGEDEEEMEPHGMYEEDEDGFQEEEEEEL